jgi:hypothetical protein
MILLRELFFDLECTAQIPTLIYYLVVWHSVLSIELLQLCDHKGSNENAEAGTPR